MVRVTIIVVLVLSVVCMVPLMGIDHATAGHLHHGATASCATCIGPESIGEVVFLLTLFGLSPLLMPITPPRPPVPNQFHPPRPR
jgi:hypothetical protein